VLISRPGLDSDVLHRLPYAVDAPFNSYAKQDSSSYLPNTRVGRLKEIYNWVGSEDERCIFWLNGLAGTDELSPANTLNKSASELASSSPESVEMWAMLGRFFTSLAVQLARNMPQIQRLVLDAIIEQEDVAN
jgi:hypothetical protein